MGDHKHHELGNGEPHVVNGDLFVLVKNPLEKRPQYFIGHCQHHGVKTVQSRHAAKKMDAVTAKAWHAFLEKAGHDFFVAVHHAPEQKKDGKYRVISVNGQGPGTVRRYL
jgi:hypothetical protein